METQNMMIAYSCVLLAGLMPYLWVSYAKFTGLGYNNKAPRDFLAKLEGSRARAHWAHLNAFEAFPLFAAGVIIAQLASVPAQQINTLAVSFVLLRLLYGVCYIKNWHLARSGVWGLALACTLALFVQAIRQS
jgi:uncharacterized MAPEG superfamily protein